MELKEKLRQIWGFASSYKLTFVTLFFCIVVTSMIEMFYPYIFSILIDEATSSLDHQSEKMIHKVIRNFANEKTVIIIAHRLSSILLADRVIVIDNGEIVGEGIHEDLLKNNSIYKKLFEYEGFAS